MPASQQRTVFITGANQGIGLALAAALASHPDYRVLMGTRSLSRGAEAIQKLANSSPEASKRISLVEIDISSDSSIAAAAASISADHGAIDILVNNAGVFPEATASARAMAAAGTHVSPSELRARLTHAFEVNVLGSTLVTETCLPLLRQSRDARRQIIFLSSALGSHALTGDKSFAYYGFDAPACTCEYSALVHGYRVLTRLARQDKSSKAALNMIMQGYAVKLAAEGIRVNAVCPGAVSTGMNGHNESLAGVEEGIVRLMELITGDGEETGTFAAKEGHRPW